MIKIFYSKKDRKTRYPLWLQILIALIICLIIVNILTSVVVREIGSGFLFQQVDNQSKKSFSLLAATALDAVISEDRPILNSIANQTLANSINIIDVIIRNERNEILAKKTQQLSYPVKTIRTYNYPILYENENFGSITITWNLDPIYTEIDRQITLSFMASKELEFLANSANDLFSELTQKEIRTPMNAILGILGLLEQTTQLLSHQANSKNLNILLDIEPNLPIFVTGDPDRVRQVLLNLINNALKFAPRGSVKIQVTSQNKSDQSLIIYFSVEGTGIGISEELPHSLFDKFTMEDQSHSRSHEGTGLGLAICKHLVSLMKGDISYISQLGKIDFFFNSNIRVLLVEDNPANQFVIKQILNHAGLTVYLASNGKEALDIRISQLLRLPPMLFLEIVNGICFLA